MKTINLLSLLLLLVAICIDTTSAFTQPRSSSLSTIHVPLRSPVTFASKKQQYKLVFVAATKWEDDNDSVPFAIRSTTPSSSSSSSSSNSNSNSVNDILKNLDVSSITDKLQDAFKDIQNIDFGSFQSIDLEAIRDNVMGGGNFGERGELYFFAQVAVALCVVFGGIPVVGDLLMLLLGPGLLAAGLSVMALSFRDMGSSMTPWPVPPTGEQAKLITDGMFQYVRHPNYAGLLAACAGLSIVTGSATRLLLTALLLYVLNVKTDYEETELVKVFPQYNQYRNKVTNKFFPQVILDQMPWMNNNNKKDE